MIRLKQIAWIVFILPLLVVWFAFAFVALFITEACDLATEKMPVFPKAPKGADGLQAICGKWFQLDALHQSFRNCRYDGLRIWGIGGGRWGVGIMHGTKSEALGRSDGAHP